jgi:DNA-binding NarL/FixJ family response regulator
MTKLIRVVIVEDTEDIRESLQTLISHKPGYNWVGSYATGEAAISDNLVYY